MHLKFSPGLLFMQFNFNSFSPCEEAVQEFVNKSESSLNNKLCTLNDDKEEIHAFRNFLSTFLLDEEEERGFVPPPSIPTLIREALSLAKRHLFLEVDDSALPQLLDSQKWLLKNAFSKGTLLHYACAGDQLEVVNYLLRVARNSSTMVNTAGHSAEFYSDNDFIKEAVWNCSSVSAIKPKSSKLLSRASRKSTRASLDESVISELINSHTNAQRENPETVKAADNTTPAEDLISLTEENLHRISAARGKYRRSSSIIGLLRKKSDNGSANAGATAAHEGNRDQRKVTEPVKVVDINPKQMVKSEQMEMPVLEERPVDTMLIRVISKLTPIETLAAEMQLDITVDPDEMLKSDDVATTVEAGETKPSQDTAASAVLTLDRLFETIATDEKGSSKPRSSPSRSVSAPRSVRNTTDNPSVRTINPAVRADSARNSRSSRSVSAPRSAVDSKTTSLSYRGPGSSNSAGSSRSDRASASAIRSGSAPRSAIDSKSTTTTSSASLRGTGSTTTRSAGSYRSVSAPRSSHDSKNTAFRGPDPDSTPRTPSRGTAVPARSAAASSRSVSAPRSVSDSKISSSQHNANQNASSSRSTSVSRSGSRDARPPGDYHELSFREMIWRRAAVFINEPAAAMVPSPIFADEHRPRGRRAHDTITPGALRSKSVDLLPAGWREDRNQRRMQQLICLQLRQEKEATIRQGIRLMRKEFQDLADVDEWPALRPKERLKMQSLLDIESS